MTRSGLNGAEAARRLLAEGPNELPRDERRTPFRIVLEVLREPMLILLLAGGAIYFALGSMSEAAILLGFAMLSIGITVVQETRTERVLEALRDLSSPRALVVRDGQHTRIAGREVVRGDLVVLAEGDRVPADALLLEGHDLQADESLLTGESVPVRKLAGGAALALQRPGGDDLPYVFSGSLVVRGTGIAEVLATGSRSEIGKIGKSLGELKSAPSRLEGEMRRLVRIGATGGALVSVCAVLLYGMLRGGWLDAVLAGIAIGMSMLPEEFPVVLTVFMAMGAWRISQARVLTRRASAIESLGSTTVLCTDKTGTLTQNRMTIAELRLADGATCRVDDGVPEAFHDLLQFGVLASAPVPFDPMEKAFHELGGSALPDEPADAADLAHQYGLRPGLLAMSNVWRRDGGFVVATKGAPEAVAELCHLDAATRASLAKAVEGMAAEGLRVLGVAQGAIGAGGFPASQHDFDFTFLGLVGLADPLRPGVTDAIAECRAAGIRVVMITGDYPATAGAIARAAGIDATHVVSGADMAKLDDAALAKLVHKASVFARILPEQKLRIVEALKAGGEVVAMTGDGVNDAPSLKAAHIGVAMGGRGTDVAREASAIVLLDDDFGSVVKAVRLGRRIYDNLRKAVAFIVAVHVPIAGLALLPLLFGLPILFGPVHIAFLEMVIDPVCSLVFEAESEEDDVMRRPPRGPAEPMFPLPLIGWSVLQGLLVLALVGGIYLGALARGMPADEVRALAFFSLVLGIVGLIFVNRSFSASLWQAVRRPNRALAWTIPAVAAMLALTLAWPWARSLFRFGPLHGDDLALTLGAAVAVVLVLEAMKPFWRRRMPR